MDNNNCPDIEVLFELADLFKVFGDSTRLRIMVLLTDAEMAVSISCACGGRISSCACAGKASRCITPSTMTM